MDMQKFKLNNKTLTLVSLVLMVLGSLLAYVVISSFNYVSVETIKFYGSNGQIISAYLYTPVDATRTTPAPGVLAIHGSNNQKDFMANVALELARRGCVVLCIDMIGHGDSEGAWGLFSSGGVDGLNYLRSLAYVNKSAIGLVGHSMGGGTIQSVALSVPDGYTALFVMDSGVSPATASSLKNLAWQWALADESTPELLGLATGWQLPSSDLIKAVFNVTEDVVPGRVYGRIEDGTARILYTPYLTHPQTTDYPESIGNVVEWFDMTLHFRNAIPRDNLIYPWKILFTSISFIAAVVFMFSFGGYLLETKYFNDLAEKVPEYKGLTGTAYWIAALITTILLPLVWPYGWSNGTTNKMLQSPLLPLTRLHGYVVSMDLVAIITLVILAVVFFILMRKSDASSLNLGLTWEGVGIDWRKIAKSFLLAVLTLTPVYVVLTYCYALFKTPFILGGMPMPLVWRPPNIPRFFLVFSYFLPFLLYYFALAILFAGFLRYARAHNTSIAKEMVINSLILSLGSIVYLLYYYIPLLAGMEQVAIAIYPVSGGKALPMIYYTPIPVFSVIVACLLTYFFRKTGKIWTGTFLATLFITLYNIAFFASYVPLPP
jgi:hypothetical protein